MESPKLPTDSLYKMLSIGGIVLVISGALLGWKAIDENALVMAEFRQSEDVLTNAATTAQLKYQFIGQRYQRIETRLDQAINGVNVDALNEFKGRQPDSFPQLADSLKLPKSRGVEFGVTPMPEIPFDASVPDWIAVVGRIRSHRDGVTRFLNARNLTVIPTALKDEALNELADLDTELSNLETLVLALAAPSQAYNSSLDQRDWATQKRSFLLYASVFLWATGIAVFGRASKNWFEQTQRYQDAILLAEAKRCEGIEIAPDVPYWREIRWLLFPVSVTLLVSVVMWFFGR